MPHTPTTGLCTQNPTLSRQTFHPLQFIQVYLLLLTPESAIIARHFYLRARNGTAVNEKGEEIIENGSNGEDELAATIGRGLSEYVFIYQRLNHSTFSL